MVRIANLQKSGMWTLHIFMELMTSARYKANICAIRTHDIIHAMYVSRIFYLSKTVFFMFKSFPNQSLCYAAYIERGQRLS